MSAASTATVVQKAVGWSIGLSVLMRTIRNTSPALPKNAIRHARISAGKTNRSLGFNSRSLTFHPIVGSELPKTIQCGSAGASHTASQWSHRDYRLGTHPDEGTRS